MTGMSDRSVRWRRLRARRVLIAWLSLVCESGTVSASASDQISNAEDGALFSWGSCHKGILGVLLFAPHNLMIYSMPGNMRDKTLVRPEDQLEPYLVGSRFSYVHARLLQSPSI